MRRALLEKERDDRRRAWSPTSTAAARRPSAAPTASASRLALTAGWQTAEAPPREPSVADELEHVGFYLSDVLYRVLPVFYEAFERRAARQSTAHARRCRRVLRFGTWVGGDMDGNPNVGADTIARRARRRSARWCSPRYRRDLRALGDVLSQSTARVRRRRRGARAHRRLPRAAAEGRGARCKPRHADMPYRNLLTLMQRAPGGDRRTTSAAAIPMPARSSPTCD